MKPLFAYAPVALLSSACASRPWTPSLSVGYQAQDVPPARATVVPTFREASTAWQLAPANTWARYQKLTLLSALDAQPTATHVLNLPDVRQLDVVMRAEMAATRVAESGVPIDAMWIVDLRGAASVAFGATLSQRAFEPIAPILTFNNWPAEHELVPAEETLASLVTMAPKLPQDGSTTSRPVFLLDAWRLAYRDQETADDVTDNRYMIQGSDLPDVQTLRAQGITRVFYLVESLDDTETEEDDLHEVLASYQEAGIALFMVDLAWALEPTEPRARYSEGIQSCSLQVVPRLTVVSDPRFYARSRGGFGGIHGVPSLGHGGSRGFFGGHGGRGFSGGHGGG